MAAVFAGLVACTGSTTGSSSSGTSGSGSTGGSTGSSTTGSSGTSSSGPTIKITDPATGSTLTYSTQTTDFDIAFTVTNFTVMDVGQCGSTANCGHVEAFVDGATCNDTGDNPPHNWNAESGASPVTIGLDYCPGFPNLASGTHTIKVELHKDDLSAVTGTNGQPISDQINVTLNLVDGGP
jgi:hypothetical protein